MSLSGKKIILGVSGSIAAYKSAVLVRLLVKAGADVQVVMTDDAASFITPVTMATLSKRECLTSFVNTAGTNWNNHVELGLWADALVIAPATANTLARMANGLCDNLLTGIYLSARCPVYIAPAMDEDMWNHPSTQANIEKLTSYGNTVIPVNNGELASGLTGPGRMAEPEEILAFLSSALDGAPAKKKGISSGLKGRCVVVTAGPTYEPIDPVRFIGNHSTGRMGIAIADEARRRGAEVYLILGPSTLRPSTEGIHIEHVHTGAEMLEACTSLFSEADIFIFSAAVADYTPSAKSEHKIKKFNGAMNIELMRTADIAYAFGEVKTDDQISVGFALETENEQANARKKLEKKNFDLVVLNSLQDEGAGFRHETNKVTLIDKGNNIEKFELKSKELVAVDILDKVEALI
jgi:phosphopantothenoylcysteine decarboxylase/phosphopantothenate--cysteine ligase